jgi:peptide chain release factor 1
MNLGEKLDKILARHDELAQLMTEGAGDADAFARLSKEYSDLTPIVEKVRELKDAQAELADLTELAASEEDPEMRSMAESELAALNGRLPELERETQLLLLPRDEADARNAIIEVRAGTGGDEAALFAAELFRMYQRYADAQGWKFEAINFNETGIGGCKEASATITGRNVFQRLKFESGTHRVHPHLRRDGGRIAGGRGRRCRYRREGLADRHLSSPGRWRPARQQDRQRGADHPYPVRHRRAVPGQQIAAQEPRPGDEGVAGAAVRCGTFAT